MPLSAGSSLGPYEILSRVGAGGMGEVYRARDTRLERTVAIKVLPAETADRPEVRQRFEREARAISALAHPNICTLHDIGRQDGIDFLVMEYLEGETLADRLKKGPLSLDHALRIAIQVADALARAHRTDITHRDLKPGNIMLTKDGAKVLDFGLAKVGAAPRASEAGATMTLAAPLTAQHTVLGTPRYMAPEQVQGAEADARSDIFSFGCVLYEMISGHHAFDAKSNAGVMAAIVEREPEPLPESLPASLRAIVLHCLEKEPGDRFQSAEDLKFALRTVSDSSTIHAAALPPPKKRKNRRTIVLLAAGLLACAAIGWILAPRGNSQTALPHYSLIAPDGAGDPPVFSPDGRIVAYQVFHNTPQGGLAIYARTLGADLPVQLLPSGSVRQTLRWSRDGRFLFYRAGAAINRISATGGPPETVIDKCCNDYMVTPSGSLLLLRQGGGSAQVLESSPPGAEPRALDAIHLPQTSTPLHLTPFSPDGKQFGACEVYINLTDSRCWIIPYPQGDARLLPFTNINLSAWHPDNRHVLSMFELPGGGSSIALLDSRTNERQFVQQAPLVIFDASMSPDGKAVSYSLGGANFDIFDVPLPSGEVRPLVQTPMDEDLPDWSPNKNELTYIAGWISYDLWIRSTDGRHVAKLARQVNGNTQPYFSPDGGRIVYGVADTLNVISAFGGTPVRVLENANDVRGIAWSPDGAWIALSRIARNGRRLEKVNSGGGAAPVAMAESVPGDVVAWSQDGRSLYLSDPQGVSRIGADGKGMERLLTVNRASYRLFNVSTDGRRAAGIQFHDDRWHAVMWDLLSGKQISDTVLALGTNMDALRLRIHPDGDRLLLTAGNRYYSLWLMEGFAQPASGLARLLRP